MKNPSSLCLLVSLLLSQGLAFGDDLKECANDKLLTELKQGDQIQLLWPMVVEFPEEPNQEIKDIAAAIVLRDLREDSGTLEQTLEVIEMLLNITNSVKIYDGETIKPVISDSYIQILTKDNHYGSVILNEGTYRIEASNLSDVKDSAYPLVSIRLSGTDVNAQEIVQLNVNSGRGYNETQSTVGDLIRIFGTLPGTLFGSRQLLSIYCQ